MEIRPCQLNIEITAQCNANCIVCSQNLIERRNKYLSFDEILSIIDQGYKLGFKSIHPHVYGEPTLHHKYSEILYEIKNRYPDSMIVEFTNGFGLNNPKILDAILNTVDYLVISIDGASDEIMRKIRPGLDPIKIREGVKELFRRRKESDNKKPFISIRMIKMAENEHEINIYNNSWSQYCDHTGIVPLLPRRCQLKYNINLIKRNNRCCHRIFDSATISVNKNAVICCEDWNEDVILGNLNDSSLKDIWLGEEFNSIRKKHLNGYVNNIPICRDCNYNI